MLHLFEAKSQLIVSPLNLVGSFSLVLVEVANVAQVFVDLVALSERTIGRTAGGRQTVLVGLNARHFSVVDH